MKLAISNIGWAPQDATAVYALMQAHGLTGLEIAPGLTFGGEEDAFVPADAAVAALRAQLGEFGLSLVSMQSLLFGVQNARLFGSAEELAQIERGLLRAIGLAERLEIPNLVFGSPGNRAYPEDMAPADATAHAIAVFRRLADRAQAAGTKLAIEPNPAAYGTNFLTTVAEAANFVVAADHPAITLNFDLGALYMNGEQAAAAALYARADGKVSHVHISEPQLAAAPADVAGLAGLAGEFLAQGYDSWFSIEMRCPADSALSVLADCMQRAVQALSMARSCDDA